jgi:hypothetical protein
MRWMFLALTTILMGGFVDRAMAGGPCQSCNAAAKTPHYGVLCADVCCSTPAYCLVPGCCEDPKHCCDNAWAGYCDHRAKVDAFWSRVGTPRSGGGCGKVCSSGNTVTTYNCSTVESTPTQPTPATPPAPPTPAENSSRKTQPTKVIVK